MHTVLTLSCENEQVSFNEFVCVGCTHSTNSIRKLQILGLSPGLKMSYGVLIAKGFIVLRVTGIVVDS